jgi:hypothetical protein
MKCPLCGGSQTLAEAAKLNTGGTTIECPCRKSPTPGWAKVGLTVGQIEKIRRDRDRMAALLDELKAVLTPPRPRVDCGDQT